MPGEITLTLPDGSVATRARGHDRGGACRVDLAASGEGRAGGHGRRPAVGPVAAARPRRPRCAIVTAKDPEALALYRHSTAHLLAAAVLELFPGTQCGIGPATDEGFFYDFVVEKPFVPEDLERIEQRDAGDCGARPARSSGCGSRRTRPRRSSPTGGEPLKVELIEEKSGPVSSCYDIKDVFLDFCVGPHVPSVGRLKHFKLLSTSNAYWKGDAKNQPMQRVYGTAFLTDDGARRRT